MNDPDAPPERRDDVPVVPGGPPEAATAGRPAPVWPVLVVALVLNVLSSTAGWPLPVQLGTGVVALLCGALVVVRRVRRR